MQGRVPQPKVADSHAPPTTRSAEVLHPDGAPSLPKPEPPPASSATKPGLSIFQKLLILILSLIIVTVALPTVYLPIRQLARMQSVMEAKAEAYSRLVAKQVESAVAFNDQETAREVFDSVSQDPDVKSLTLFTARGNVLKARGEISPQLRALWREPHPLVVLPDRVASIAPVVSLEGPRGTLVLELSTERLALHRREIVQQALISCAIALLLGAAGAFWIARALGDRLTAIARVADTVRGGELDQPPLVDTGRDEIAVVVRAFNSMLQQLRSLIAQIQLSAREEQRRLELLVLERTSELDSRNADLRLVLDHVEQGFVTLGRDGEMSRERSAILERWLGRAPQSERFADYLTQVSEPTGAWFAMGWETLAEDLLPLELALDQLPKRIQTPERTMHIGYRAILDMSGALTRVLVVLSDITPELERVRAESDERELTRLFTRLLTDRGGLIEFRAEVEGLLGKLSGGGEPACLKSWLHTLKGSAGMYGVDSLSTICHQLEERLSQDTRVSPEQLAPLARRWHELDSKLKAVLDRDTTKLQIELAEYEEMMEAVARGLPPSELLPRLAGWRHELVRVRLMRLAEHAEKLAERLGKAPIVVALDAGTLRIPSERWEEFWSALVHVVRNAVDHGLETAQERQEQNKAVPARLSLSAKVVNEHVWVEVSDDGRGIDWNLIETKATSVGLPASSHEELVVALFASGFSTRASASEVSGRGIGLGIARDACLTLGGRVEVESRLGEGTVFRFSWPLASLRSTRVIAPPVSHRSFSRREPAPAQPSSEVLAMRGTPHVATK